MKNRMLYSVLGVVLGLGAPIGALVGQGLMLNSAWWNSWILAEWNEHAYFYVYMGVGCVIVLGLFGFYLGKRFDRLHEEGENLSGTFQTLNLLAIKDGLTGLYNHRYLQERLGLEMEVADRRNMPLTCLMIDIDDFKAVNDRSGHPFGDTVLSGTARILRDNIRTIDTAGRYGGEEFLILMPQTHPEVAENIAERIRKAVAGHMFQGHDHRARITLSIGIASYPKAGMEPGNKAAFLEEVDAALYHAKQSGKNRVFYQSSNNHRRQREKEAI